MKSHRLANHDGEIEISFVLEPGGEADPQAIVFEILETAVESIGGRISSEDDWQGPSDSTTVFEQLGTYLVPA